MHDATKKYLWAHFNLASSPLSGGKESFKTASKIKQDKINEKNGEKQG